MSQQNILSQLKGLRVLVIYDNFYTLGSLCFYAAPYYLIEGSEVYIIIFSEHIYRNAKRVYEYALKNYPIFLNSSIR